MEWHTGDLIWFDPELGHWLPGEILEIHTSANVITVQAVINGKAQTFALTDWETKIRRRQDLGTGGVEDMIQLDDLHEAALLWNLKLRYEKNLIYTYTGSILVAVNPYRLCEGSYGIETAQKYKGKMIGMLPPHLFALGASAYASLPLPQVVIISGESGSGKTESTKLVMQYLAAVAPSAPRGQALVTEQILEAAPLLEAFGNARTARNDNSSRFGKYLEVYFKNGSIVGAKMTQYLLEKSRIVTQAPGERNYHVFYELLGGLSGSEKQKYGLVEADKYFYLNQGGGDCAPGHSGSGADWGALTRAMEVLGVGESEQEGIVKVLGSILHLGNIYFHRRQLRHGQEGVEVGSGAEIKWAAHLLQISPTGLQRALTSRMTEARAEKVYSPLNIDQALDARDAFAKALYAALFNWLVTRVNSIVQRGGLHNAARISLLDIFGFENLNENSFEQLCINFASESLQQYFNKHVFKLEQQEYAKEKLEWTNMTWNDNTPVIQLLGKKPVGIFHLLDDESNFPRATDSSFLEKCHYNHALNENYCRPRVGGREFGIRHYAGQVWYSVDGFLDKNRDQLRPEIVDLLSSSKEPLVSAIAKPLLNQAQTKTLPRGTNGRFVTMKPRTPTVAARFGDSLHHLLESMSKCNPWFVRCIKPNNEKAAMKFDMPVVLEQLRYAGMLDTIKIRQSGYPIRMKFQQFVDRYRYLLNRIPRGAPFKDLCRNILENMPHSNSEGPDYQLGSTRVFLREHLSRALEVRRGESLQGAAVTIQKHIRGYLARKDLKLKRDSAIMIQKHWKRYKQREDYLNLKNAAIIAQALYRGRKERKLFAKRKAEFKRRVEAEKVSQERAKQRAAREARLQAQAQKANTKANKSNNIHHLEIPAELAFVFCQLDGYVAPHTEKNLVKVLGGINGNIPDLILPHDLNQFEFAKFSSVYFKDADFHFKKEPITSPFLSKAAARDQDYQDAIAIFKLILRWSNDPQLSGNRERALADYLVCKGLNSRGLRDEILVQLCNQTWKNENSDRVWQLMAHCLSCFQPSPSLSKYLLKYITDHAPANLKEILQRKLMRGIQRNPHSRMYPPSLLEWRSIRQRTNMALPLSLSDNTVTTVFVDSWTTCDEAASTAISSLGLNSEGWSVLLDDAGIISEGNGVDYILDLVSELELYPALPVSKQSFLKIGTKKMQSVEIDHHNTSLPSPVRPQEPPPEPPITVVPTKKISNEIIRVPSPSNNINTNSNNSSRKSSKNITPQRKESSSNQPSSSRKTSHEALSRSSALNERYFEVEKIRSRSLDNLLNEAPEPTPLVDLGLSQSSKLNERYHSVEQLNAPIKPVITYMSKEEIDFEYPDTTSSINTSHRGGGPRYIKSQYAGKKAPPGSHSSRAYIEKSEFRSSAMSDTSEAPSLASHVRRVRVPSQASDVDQFLDELFSPVLDGNLDELSDARSLAASIKGGQHDYFDDFIDDTLSHDDNTLYDLSNIDSVVRKIKGGGTKKDSMRRTSTSEESSVSLDQEVENINDNDQNNVDEYISELFKPIFVNDSLKKLTEKQLVDSIKGGGSTQNTTASSSNYISQPIVNMMSDGFMPVFNMSPTLSNMNTQDMSVYQQNLQRAFLQSAMAQNIQIQQQLLAQNQALQQLLTQQVGTSGDLNVKVTETFQTTVKAQVHQDAPRKSSSDLNRIKHNGIPAPPPLPPPLEEIDPSEVRPFMDPYGRAKTVRIGKWRWPPPQDESLTETAENFMQFKMRQNQRKITPSNQEQNIDVSFKIETSAEWDQVEYDPIVKETEKISKSSKKAFEIGASRPSPGSVGKLKLSSEMRQRLEQVTANHSIRSTSSKVDKPSHSVNKLEETRKMMLEQQLMGRWGDNSTENNSGKSSPDTTHINSSNNWKPGPPPPPVGPDFLPPAPPGPAPSPPIVRSSPNVQKTTRNSFKSATKPVKTGREHSFIAQRQDRDTFGVHQNKIINNSKRNSFSANWEIQSGITEMQDDATSWAKDDLDNLDHVDSTTVTSIEPTHQIFNDRWQRDEKIKIEKKHLLNKSPNERPTFRTHQHSKSAQEREKKFSVTSTVITDKTEQSEVQEWPEFMRPIQTPAPISPTPQNDHLSEPKVPVNKLLPFGTVGSITYNRIAWLLRVRKEYFSPSESLGSLNVMHLIFCQIIYDVYGITPCIRLTTNEKRAGVTMLSGYGINAENFNNNHRTNIKRTVIELARTWPLYFSRMFVATGAAQLSEVQLIAVSHWGVHLVKREANHLEVIKSYGLESIISCTAPRPTTVNLECLQDRISLHTSRAQQISEMVTKFCGEYRKIQAKSNASHSHPHQHQQSRSPAIEKMENINDISSVTETIPSKMNYSYEREESKMSRDGSQSPNNYMVQPGKYSMMQFAMNNYRLGMSPSDNKKIGSPKGKDKRSKDWTWKQQTDLIKWQGTLIEGPLLKLEDPEVFPLAIECFECILRYCGDMPLHQDMSEVKCVYTVLMHCHKFPQLRDEVYCQLMKQTTSNKSENPESCQRAWRLLSIVAAYFACSEKLLPYLMEHLTNAANDRRRICHGTAAVCLSNMRKTQRCGGRKNVPSVEEVTAVSAGRSARRQIYRLPGGAERVVNTRCSTVVADVIQELCSLIEVVSEEEQQEFSLYCIVQGDAFTMPLAADEYILDVTTELHKAAQPFYLIFCRSVWYYPLKHDATPLYTEVLFNQVAPDYLEGLLLRLGTPALAPSVVRDMALIAALLHRAADMEHSPSIKEVKYLLPKPILGLREPRPPQWLALVQTSWEQVVNLTMSRAKHRVLHVLSTWPLFGSSFFAVKRVAGEIEQWQDQILALNRSGVHFLDINSHETLQHWPFAEVISTRKVRSEDGSLFLDMKCGNLLQQRVTRLQTEQAHEISRLVRQYINLEQDQRTNGNGHN